VVFVRAARRRLSLAFMSAHPPILLGTLGMTDSLILMVMALVVFGPRRLPQIGRQIGKLMYEFRKASNDFKFQMEEELRNAEEADRRKKEDERQRLLAAQTTAEQASVSAAPPPAAKVAVMPSPGDKTDTPAPDLKAEDGTPRIMPPSTGEQVAAAKPSHGPDYYYSQSANGQEATQPGEAEAAGRPQQDPSKAETDSAETASSQADNATEAMNQHG
jgi:sec-independent protein translocase protein TatB